MSQAIKKYVLWYERECCVLQRAGVSSYEDYTKDVPIFAPCTEACERDYDCGNCPHADLLEEQERVDMADSDCYAHLFTSDDVESIRNGLASEMASIESLGRPHYRRGQIKQQLYWLNVLFPVIAQGVEDEN